MNILRFYVGKTILTTSLITLLALALIRILFALIDQMNDFGKGAYQFMDGLAYSLMLAPKYIYEFFPMAILIGCISGLGILASRSELTVMRAVGKTTGQIIGSALSYGLILIALAIFLGEFVAPKTTKAAEDLRNRAIHGDQFLKSNQGLWLKDGLQMIRLDEVLGQSKLKGVTIYQLDSDQQLRRITQAASATLVDDAWQLANGQHHLISDEQIQVENFDAWHWNTSIALEHLSALRQDPENFNLLSLNDYRNYLNANGQDTQAYDLAFWRKIIQPLSTAVMILLAASFIFGPMRSVSMGARVLVGVVTGLIYFFTVRAFGPVSLVFGLPAFLGALLPPLIFAGIAWYLLKKAG
ncbi:LPS export ABC transporter permease LptG [Kangiella sp. TOML190]|uniref:LPS export ABC transporter permease LptG n=1 Tax=Kangiella sp. TOML190 TaxID=2931351 RepID=UPI00203ACCA3|nr:LPS export ABC transporter permease LptG [Kangiella sp. TOML190]